MTALLSSTLYAQYGGPSILSRGGNQPGRRGRAPVSFTGYVGSVGRYETGLLLPATAGSDNLVPTTDDFGVAVEGGVYGGHDWRRHSIGLDYRGDYRWQANQKQIAGANNVLALDYIVRVSRRIQLFLRESGGSTNRAFGSFAAPAYAEMARQGTPVNELFDVRTYFAQSSAGLTWAKSPRFQMTGQIDAFFIKRKNDALINSQGYTGSGNAMWRLNRDMSIGGEYQFLSFNYPHIYSGTQAHGPGIRFIRRLGRSVSLTGHGGFFLVRSTGVENVQLSPEVAAILGHPTAPASYDRNSTTPNIDANITWTQARGAARMGYSYGIGMGNGVYLATTRSSVNGGYSYSGIRKVSLGISASLDRNVSTSITLPSYSSWRFGGGLSYKLTDSLNFTSNLDNRVWKNVSAQSRNGISFSFGLAYSTSSLPLSIW